MKMRFLLIMMLVLLMSCYVPSSRVYNLSAKQNDAIWLNGKELVKLTEDNIEVIVNFDMVKHGIVSFDISIANNTDETVLINPVDFYCSVTNRLEEEKKINALDPEKLILNYDNQMEKLYAENKSDNQTELLFSLFDLADDIHNNNKTGEEIEQKKTTQKERDEMYDNKEENYISNINRIANERDLLEHQALRKTTLFPDQKMNGTLFFEIPGSTMSLVIYIPIENRKMKLEYEIVK